MDNWKKETRRIERNTDKASANIKIINI